MKKELLSHEIKIAFLISVILVFVPDLMHSAESRKSILFNQAWKFLLEDERHGQSPDLNDKNWRTLDLPHDWSIEGEFSKDHPSTPGGGALPGGVGWYRKSFSIPTIDKNKLCFIEFDGVYRNSEVWINGHYLGKRPYGYSSFQYELTPYLNYGNKENILAVRVDNSQQPNSRWYSGSGIYRNVWLVMTGKIYVDHWGTFITSSVHEKGNATVTVRTAVKNSLAKAQSVIISTTILDNSGTITETVQSKLTIPKMSSSELIQKINIKNPKLWDLDSPNLYKAVSEIELNKKKIDEYTTPFGIRSFTFEADEGFVLNGKKIKIHGVCNHHDLGCLGAAINTRALERQLEIMKRMGVNGIRTSHNPPAPELLDLCDKMGFIVMDEAFDMWKKKKTEFDYSLDWNQWHTTDLTDMILRDRNHPSIFIWSIGNEVVEQWDHNDSSGTEIAIELAGIIKNLDSTRPITANCNDINPDNPVIRSGVLDLIGYSYGHNEYHLFPRTYPGKCLIGSETTSALATRGHYDMPSDSIRRWPIKWDIPFTTGNADNTVSSYDNCSAPWGGTHEEVLKLVKKNDFVSGMYIWTGFDYIGEPTPYLWPSRSSYFGIVDLAGFPKDMYYLYQSEWTDKPVLHVFPHWNWKVGDTVDVLAYTNCTDVELFLNGESLGTKRKLNDNLHLMWRVPFEPGSLKAIGRGGQSDSMVSEIKTAGVPATILLEPDRTTINADGRDLSFVTVIILDASGTTVLDADNLIHFSISGEGKIAGVDNGLQTSMESFKTDHRKAFNGLCLVVIQSTGNAGQIELKATSLGLKETKTIIQAK